MPPVLKGLGPQLG
jgi:hypothetical protein